MSRKLFTMADRTVVSATQSEKAISQKTTSEKTTIEKAISKNIIPQKQSDLKVIEDTANTIEKKRDSLVLDKTKKKKWISRLKNKFFHPVETKQENKVALVRHVSCMFVMDVSESMNYPKENPNIEALNHALKEFKKNMTQACRKCHVQMDIGMVTFHGAEAALITPFTPMSEWNPQHLNASGVSPMGQGLQLAFDSVIKSREQWEREKLYIEESWIILFTDGRPTDSIKDVADQIKAENQNVPKRFNFWIVASGDADRKICEYLSDQVIYMKGSQYEKTFYTLQKEMLLTMG